MSSLARAKGTKSLNSDETMENWRLNKTNQISICKSSNDASHIRLSLLNQNKQTPYRCLTYASRTTNQAHPWLLRCGSRQQNRPNVPYAGGGAQDHTSLGWPVTAGIEQTPPFLGVLNREQNKPHVWPANKTKRTLVLLLVRTRIRTNKHTLSGWLWQWADKHPLGYHTQGQTPSWVSRWSKTSQTHPYWVVPVNCNSKQTPLWVVFILNSR